MRDPRGEFVVRVGFVVIVGGDWGLREAREEVRENCSRFELHRSEGRLAGTIR